MTPSIRQVPLPITRCCATAPSAPPSPHDLDALARLLPLIAPVGNKLKLNFPHRSVTDAALTRFIQADYQADRFNFAINEQAITDAERFDGKLVLLSNVPDYSTSQIVTSYKSLADIERGFRVLKSDIEIAPVYHRLPDRIRAHALICFLALYRVMRMRLKASGNKASPGETLEILRHIQRHRATIGDKRFSGLSKTTPEQLELFEALKLPKPQKSPL